MSSPILSICIPTYNRANQLKTCLKSIVFQFSNKKVYEQVEIVISDNASEDNTAYIVKEFQKKFNNIKYFRNNKNLGFDLNVISVVKNSSAKYCWYLGDDDVIINDGIKFVLNKLKSSRYDVLTVEAVPLSKSFDFTIKSNLSKKSFIDVKDYNDFYFNGYCQGGFSVLVFNRNLWLSCVDGQDFLEYWLYYETILRVMVKSLKKMVYIKDPIIYTGQDCRWVKNGAELFTFINSNILLERMIDFGFDKNRILKNLKINKKRIPIILLRAKGHGLKCNLENLKYIYKNFSQLPLHYLVLINLIYFVPNKIIVIVRDLKKIIKNKI